MNFKSFSFDPALLRALDELNFETLTPVQRAAIPPARKGMDVLASAQTGTGKTAAFALPLLQKLLEDEAGAGSLRTLVLTPTRELAEQVAENFRAFARHTNLRIAQAFGGVNHAGQAQALKDGCDILVATPGRLLDHIRLGNVTLSRVRHLVLDEADRMLDMGFIGDIQTVLQHCPQERQMLLFSATFQPAIKQFAAKVLSQPEIIEVDSENSTARTVHHLVYPVEQKRKRELLSELIGKKNWRQILVFVNMKETADELVEELKLDGISAVVCHGDKKQGSRRRALREFKEGKARVLVATEVAARGIDIAGLPRVINLDVPYLAEDYVHRIGRTGRAGKLGQAITFVSREEEHSLFEIEKLIGQKIKRVVMSGYEVSSRESLLKGIAKKPSHQRRGARSNRPGGQASAEARAKNRSRIARVRKTLKGQKLKLDK